MAQIRPRENPVDREGAARELVDALIGQPPANDLRSLVHEAGGASRVGELVGRSTRTIYRWMAGEVDHVPREARDSLARQVQADRTRGLVDQLGGADRVAAMTGRSRRTVERWMSGRIRTPRTDARQVLQRGATATRMSAHGIDVDPSTGQPLRQVFFKLSGGLRAKGNTPTPGYKYNRRIGVELDPRGQEIPDAVIAEMVDALSRGDQWSAHAAFEEWLSTGFSAVGTYQPELGFGMFVDRIDDIEFNQ